jgi:hypothetical protein
VTLTWASSRAFEFSFEISEMLVTDKVDHQEVLETSEGGEGVAKTGPSALPCLASSSVTSLASVLFPARWIMNIFSIQKPSATPSDPQAHFPD